MPVCDGVLLSKCSRYAPFDQMTGIRGVAHKFQYNCRDAAQILHIFSQTINNNYAVAFMWSVKLLVAIGVHCALFVITVFTLCFDFTSIVWRRRAKLEKKKKYFMVDRQRDLLPHFACTFHFSS